MLEYFDAFTVGLTATPSLHTLGFFGKNLVAQYPYERSVVDGVNVGFEIFRIRTEIGERGATVKAGYDLPVRDKRTRAERYETLDGGFQLYAGSDRSLGARRPTRSARCCETYRDTLFTELFPGRNEVPKTLVFAKDDHHAEEIVEHRSAKSSAKATTSPRRSPIAPTAPIPESLIRAFRNDYNPRIAVTVDMIATGTDVKPLEVLIFLRDVKSELYFEQMKGRGARTISPEKLREVTPDAEAKTRFVLIDAVGVSESLKSVSQPLERDRVISFEKLIDGIASGRRDDDAFATLAARLAALDRRIGEKDRAAIVKATGGVDLPGLAAQAARRHRSRRLGKARAAGGAGARAEKGARRGEGGSGDVVRRSRAATAAQGREGRRGHPNRYGFHRRRRFLGLGRTQGHGCGRPIPSLPGGAPR